MRPRHFFAALLVLATLARAQAPEAPATPAPAPPAAQTAEPTPEARGAVERAELMLKAALADDAETVVKYTYPAALAELGGPKQALAQTEAAMRDAKARGFSYAEYVLEAPTPVHRVDRRLYIAIPTRFVLVSPQGRLVGRSYLLGVSDDRGNSWTFADGAGLTDPRRRISLFVDLPPQLVLPAVEQPHPQ